MSLTEEVLDYIRTNPGCTRSDILSAFPEGTNPTTVSCLMNRLQVANTIENRGPANRWARWYPIDVPIERTYLSQAEILLEELAKLPPLVRRDYLAQKLQEVASS